MLTGLTVRNFKRFEEVEIELGNPVVFVGPNNSGKTTAMQALALWDAGLKQWLAKRSGRTAPEKRPGVTVNRRDLTAIPLPTANMLWRGLHTRRVERGEDGKQRTDNIRIDIIVDGVTEDRHWACGLEFDYANEESFYCRPLRTGGDGRMPVPPEAGKTQIAFLPPMSGLAATEILLPDGAVKVRIGEGRTAEVLRNLCYAISSDRERSEVWEGLVAQIDRLFGVRLEEPRHAPQRGEIEMAYREDGVRLDLSSSGRGLQQTLLILAYLYANPGNVLLLDEPDAHLEILRQREIYGLLSETAERSGSQVIAASHSEVLLNEAAGRDLVIAFVGQPHPIGDRKSQLYKALAEIGWDQYYQARETGWVLYLEGPTDLAILQNFARRLDHRAAVEALARPFVHYCGNQTRKAFSHFHGLAEAVPDLKGIALFDRLATPPRGEARLPVNAWRQREIENYLCTSATLEAWAGASAPDGHNGPLFVAAQAENRMEAMREAVVELSDALRMLNRGSPWDGEMKVSDEFLPPLFDSYFGKLTLPNLMRKKNFHELADHVPDGEIDPEIREKLDAIARVAESAGPA